MRWGIMKVKGIGFFIWHAKHELFHIVLGLLWLKIVSGWWGVLHTRWVFVAAFGSLVPDIDHLIYFFTYGRRDPYTKQVFSFLKRGRIGALTMFLEKGHKYNTNLSSHNFYIMGLLVLGAFVASVVDWYTGVILFGAMQSHYLFDVAEDLLILGHINPNWRRWGRGDSFTDISTIDKFPAR